MLSIGSRYYDLTESSPLNARGERSLGKDLRAIPRRAGEFLHLVADGDRLDLLAFKYYGDPEQWWLIADANPEFEFPGDLLDRSPMVEERLVLGHAEFASRLESLRAAASAFGEVREIEMSPFEGAPVHRKPDLIESRLVVTYAPESLRSGITGEIKSRFRFLRSFAWETGSKTAEAFTFDDPLVKARFRAVITALAGKPGVSAVRPEIGEAAVGIQYHRDTFPRSELLGIIASNGFSIEQPRSLSVRTGSKIIIPPNEIA
jgi:hypothetical protein